MSAATKILPFFPSLPIPSLFMKFFKPKCGDFYVSLLWQPASRRVRDSILFHPLPRHQQTSVCDENNDHCLGLCSHRVCQSLHCLRSEVRITTVSPAELL